MNKGGPLQTGPRFITYYNLDMDLLPGFLCFYSNMESIVNSRSLSIYGNLDSVSNSNFNV